MDTLEPKPARRGASVRIKIRPIRGAVFGLRYTALVELGLLLGLALAVDRFFLDGTRFRSLALHPFWIPVLLLSVQYGTNAGLLAAIASTLALLAGNLPPQGLLEDRFVWLFETSRLPLLWFGASVVLGELRSRQLRESEQARRDLGEARGRESVLVEAYKRLEAAKEALETRVAGQLRTALALYEAVRGIEKLDPAEVLLGVSTLVRSVMNPERFSLYLLQNGSLELVLVEGGTAEDALPQFYHPETRLFQETVGRQRVLSVANPEDEDVLAGAGMISAPLVATSSGRVVGMLKIEKLGFLDLNFSNVQTFQALSRWVGTAYENALRYQAARADAVVNSETELFAYGFLSRQLAMLELLARRIGFDVTMIVMRLENAEDLTAEQQTRVPVALSRAVKTVLRRSDLAFDYRRTGHEFALVLPATRVEGARTVIGKLAEALREELKTEAPQARFAFSVQAIHDTSNATQEGEANARSSDNLTDLAITTANATPEGEADARAEELPSGELQHV
jgi:polysaccharide biosynthesis protein PelD